MNVSETMERCPKCGETSLLASDIKNLREFTCGTKTDFSGFVFFMSYMCVDNQLDQARQQRGREIAQELRAKMSEVEYIQTYMKVDGKMQHVYLMPVQPFNELAEKLECDT